MTAPAPGAAPGFRVAYDAALVEECVLLAEPRLGGSEAEAFRGERDRIYGVLDLDEREARFEALHGRLFLRLGLDRPLHEELARLPELLVRSRGCRVLPAVTRQEESADVCAERAATGAAPTIVLRLRPQSLLEPEALRPLLRRELLHVADMLDLDFGYVTELPLLESDPAILNLLRERYRVVWDTTIDGRLCRRGLLGEPARSTRLAEFARAFPMLGEDSERVFARWFDIARPTHGAIVAFIEQPLGPGSHDAARCPLCHLPQRRSDGEAAVLDANLVRAIERDRPGWAAEQGCCARCAELYGVGVALS
jgi:hypothetical protein